MLTTFLLFFNDGLGNNLILSNLTNVKHCMIVLISGIIFINHEIYLSKPRKLSNENWIK